MCPRQRTVCSSQHRKASAHEEISWWRLTLQKMWNEARHTGKKVISILAQPVISRWPRSGCKRKSHLLSRLLTTILRVWPQIIIKGAWGYGYKMANLIAFSLSGCTKQDVAVQKRCQSTTLCRGEFSPTISGLPVYSFFTLKTDGT